MERFFIAAYRWFRSRKAALWLIQSLSLALFVVLGLQVAYEEDLTKLLPNSDAESELAFGNLRVKDKVFLQFTSHGSPLDTDALGGAAEEFCKGLVQRDSATGYISNILCGIGADMAMNALDFALSHVPALVDTSLYAEFDRALEPDAVAASMRADAEAIMNDWTGSATQAAATDPLNLRSILAGTLMAAPSDAPAASLGMGLSGYALVDGHLFCPDSTVALAFLAPNFKSLDSGSATKLAKEIDAQIADFGASHPEVKVLYHGTPINSVSNSARIKKDLVLTIGASLLLILLCIALCFRSFSILWQTLFPVVYGAFFALSCMFLIKGGMSLMALGLGAIVLGVAISYCLHIIIHFRCVHDVERTLREESVPVILGCLTTIGAFLGLLFTKSELLRDFGLFATFALVGSTLHALVFLPHLLREPRRPASAKAFRLIDAVNSYPYDRNKALIVAVCAVILIGVAFAPKVRFDSDLRHLGYYSQGLVESQGLYSSKNLSGAEQVYYAATGATLDEALETNRRVVEVLDSLADEGIVKPSAHIVPALFVAEAVQRERIAAWRAYWSEGKVALARQRISAAARSCGLDPETFEPFYTMVQADYEPASLYDAGVIPESLLSNFIEESEGRFLIFNPVRLSSGDRQAVSEVVTAQPHAVVIDPFFYTGSMIRVIHDDFNVALGISSLFVLAVLLLSFRNVWVALIAFLPMFFSWYVVQGLMAMFGVQFNLINIVISTFIFGIGVDYSIFVMQGLLAGLRSRDSELLANHKVAIFFSALVLFIVVVALMFAAHPAIRSIGLSTLIGMASTIVITYTLQPFLFRGLSRRKWFHGRTADVGDVLSDSGASAGQHRSGSHSAHPSRPADGPLPFTWPRAATPRGADAASAAGGRDVEGEKGSSPSDSGVSAAESPSGAGQVAASADSSEAE